RLPPTSSARNSKTGKKESTGRRLSQLCPPYATPSSNSSFDYRRSDARIVENGFATSGGVSKSAKVVLERDDFSSNRHLALAFWWSMIFFRKPVPTFRDHALEPHPCGETRKLGTSCWDRRQEPVCRGPGRRQVCFKFGRRSIGERRVQ